MDFLLKTSMLRLGLALAVLSAAGCEGLALVGRPSIDSQTTVSEHELRARVDRVDARSREIHLRTDRGRTEVVNYNADTRVIRGGREYPVNELRVGDTVAVQLRQDSRGGSYSDLIRIEDAYGSGDYRRSDSGVQTLSGTVERVDSRGGNFDMREFSGDRIIVALPSNARRSEIERLERLRNGDQVRVEGRFVGRDRFELEAFL